MWTNNQLRILIRKHCKEIFKEQCDYELMHLYLYVMGCLKAERLEIVSCIMNLVQVFGKIRWILHIKKNILDQFSRNSNHLSRKILISLKIYINKDILVPLNRDLNTGRDCQNAPPPNVTHAFF
ncbi:unnamed protein product [Rhizophagus irregularis]|nr:unnamed protein product [Rhizophagus irregularis]